MHEQAGLGLANARLGSHQLHGLFMRSTPSLRD